GGTVPDAAREAPAAPYDEEPRPAREPGNAAEVLLHRPPGGRAELLRELVVRGDVQLRERQQIGRRRLFDAPGHARPTGSSTTTGMRRVVRRSYSAKLASCATIARQSRARSSPSASRARTSTTRPPTWTRAFGSARRFSHQAGWRGSPANEAATTNASPSAT